MLSSSDISTMTGLTGVEVGHIMDAIHQHGIDPSVVDWEQVIGQIRDYGDRYQAAWDYLRDHYGIIPPMTPYRAHMAHRRYEDQEILFNADNLQDYIQRMGIYTEVMDALCLGRGDVPREIQEAFFEGPDALKGRKKQEFLDYLCQGYTPTLLGKTSNMRERAIRNYERGIRNFGVETYAKCATHDGWYAVSRCLHESGQQNICIKTMVERYRETA